MHYGKTWLHHPTTYHRVNHRSHLLHTINRTQACLLILLLHFLLIMQCDCSGSLQLQHITSVCHRDPDGWKVQERDFR